MEVSGDVRSPRSGTVLDPTGVVGLQSKILLSLARFPKSERRMRKTERGMQRTYLRGAGKAQGETSRGPNSRTFAPKAAQQWQEFSRRSQG